MRGERWCLHPQQARTQDVCYSVCVCYVPHRQTDRQILGNLIITFNKRASACREANWITSLAPCEDGQTLRSLSALCAR